MKIIPFLDRKSFAAEATKHGIYAPILFRMYDGKNYASYIWKMVKPVGHTVFKVDQDQ